MARRPLDLTDAPAVPATTDILDKSKSYGEIGGRFDRAPTARYSQKDKHGILRYYDGGGQRLKVAGEPPDGARVGSVPKPAQKPAPQPAPPGAPTPGEREFVPGEEVLVGDVNLTAWALQRAKYPFATIRAAFFERFAMAISSEADAFEFLVKQKIVTMQMLHDAGVALSSDE